MHGGRCLQHTSCYCLFVLLAVSLYTITLVSALGRVGGDGACPGVRSYLFAALFFRPGSYLLALPAGLAVSETLLRSCVTDGTDRERLFVETALLWCITCAGGYGLLDAFFLVRTLEPACALWAGEPGQTVSDLAGNLLTHLVIDCLQWLGSAGLLLASLRRAWPFQQQEVLPL